MAARTESTASKSRAPAIRLLLQPHLLWLINFTVLLSNMIDMALVCSCRRINGVWKMETSSTHQKQEMVSSSIVRLINKKQLAGYRLKRLNWSSTRGTKNHHLNYRPVPALLPDDPSEASPDPPRGHGLDLRVRLVLLAGPRRRIPLPHHRDLHLRHWPGDKLTFDPLVPFSS